MMQKRGETDAVACDWITGSCCSSDAGERVVGDLTWFRVGLALAFSGQGMVFGLGYNNALAAGEAPAFGTAAYWALHAALLASAGAVVLMLGFPLARSTWASVRERQVTVEGLFLLTASGALFASVLSSARGEGSVYYEVVGLVLVIYTVGRKVGARTRGRALSAANHWRERFSWAHVATSSGNRRRVAVSALTAGDRVIVLPGEGIPVDGVIVAGRSEVQETIVTGELVPVARGVGERVHAGSHAVDGRLEIEATHVGHRLLDNVLATVESAVARPSRFQTQADRLMRWFLPWVVLTSGATFLGWWWGGGLSWADALFNAMSVLLVACPCALGLATPIAVWSGLLALSQRGLVSRDGQLLEALANTRTWLFDKTGTLSEAHLGVTDFEVLDTALDAAWLRAAVASLEAGLSHPIAQSLARLSEARLPVEDLRVVAGRGVQGHCAGRFVRVGRPGWTSSDSTPPAPGRWVEVEVDGCLAARVTLRESLPPTRVAALERLKEAGTCIRILSGDPDPERTEIAGIAVEGGLLPEAKVERVRACATKDPFTIFVGDGLNDAAALAAAPVGLALNGGAGLSQASAAGILMGDQIEVLPWAVHFCRRLRDRLRGNLVFALGYNVFGISLAAAGILHPVAAALLMLGSSLIVSVRAAQISRWTETELQNENSSAFRNY